MLLKAPCLAGRFYLTNYQPNKMNYRLIVQRTDQEKRRNLLITGQYPDDDFPEHLNYLVQDIN